MLIHEHLMKVRNDIIYVTSQYYPVLFDYQTACYMGSREWYYSLQSWYYLVLSIVKWHVARSQRNGIIYPNYGIILILHSTFTRKMLLSSL